jgi:hypothetical protein
MRAFLFLAFLFPLALSAQDVNLSDNYIFQGEPNMVVDPQDPDHIVVSWMGTTIPYDSSLHIKTKVSWDGGRTWGDQSVHPHTCAGCGSADPTMVYDDAGRVYLAYIDFESDSCAKGGILLRSSNDGGVSWSDTSRVWDIGEISGEYPIDRPWMAIDHSGTASDGDLYMTTMPGSNCGASTPNEPYLKVSTDQGQTWSPYRTIDTAGFQVGPYIGKPMAYPAVNSNGSFFVTYPSYVPSQDAYPRFFFGRSDDEGVSYMDRGIVADTLQSASAPLLKKGKPFIAAPNDSDRMAQLFIDSRHGDPDLFVATTDDAGGSWGPLTRVNDDPIGNDRAQDLAWADYNEDGELLVTWRDRRMASDSGYKTEHRIYGAISTDNGATWSGNFPISEGPLPYDSILAKSGNDFMDCAFIGDTAYAVWGDTREGHLEVFFRRRCRLHEPGSKSKKSCKRGCSGLHFRWHDPRASIPSFSRKDRGDPIPSVRYGRP